MVDSVGFNFDSWLDQNGTPVVESENYVEADAAAYKQQLAESGIGGNFFDDLVAKGLAVATTGGVQAFEDIPAPEGVILDSAKDMLSVADTPFNLEDLKIKLGNLPAPTVESVYEQAQLGTELPDSMRESATQAAYGVSYEDRVKQIREERNVGRGTMPSKQQAQRALDAELAASNPSIAAQYEFQGKWAVSDKLADLGFSTATDSEGKPLVNYDTPIQDLGFRAALAWSDTDKEVENRIEEFTGKPAKRDAGGRWLYFNEENQQYAAVDSPAWEFPEDIVEVGGNWVGPIVGAAVGLVTTRGMNRLPQAAKLSQKLVNAQKVIFTEAGLASTGQFVQEGIEQMAGWNDEEVGEVGRRLLMDFAADVSFTNGLQAIPVAARFGKNPLHSSINDETRAAVRAYQVFQKNVEGRDPEEFLEVVSQLQSFDRRVKNNPDLERAYKADPQMLTRDFPKLSTSQLNASDFLARMEGILSKMPGSGALYKANKARFNELIRYEVAWLMRDQADPAKVAGVLQKHMQKFYAQQLKANNSVFALYLLGKEERLGDVLENSGEVVLDVLGRGKAIGEQRAKNMANSLRTQTSDAPAVIDTNEVLTRFFEERKKYRPDLSEPLEGFSKNPNVSRQIEDYLTNLPDFMTVDDYRTLLSRVSDYYKAGGGGNDSAMTATADALSKALKSAFNVDAGGELTGSAFKRMRDLGYSDEQIEYFGKSFHGYNKFYLDEQLMWSKDRNPQSIAAKILDRYRANTENGLAGGEEHIIDMMLPYVAQGGAGAPNLAFARYIKENATPLELNNLAKAATFRLLGDGTDRTGQDIINMIGKSGSTQRAIWGEFLGEGRIASIQQLAKQIDVIQGRDMYKFAQLDQEPAKLLNTVLKGKTPANYLDAKNAILSNPNVPQATKDATIQQLESVYLQNNILDKVLKMKPDESYRSIDGKALMQLLETEKDNVDAILGADTRDMLFSLGLMSRDSSKSGTAGGLAVGAFIINMLQNADIVGAAVTGVKLNLLARFITSDMLQSYLTKEVMSEAAEKNIQQAAVGLYYFARYLRGEEAYGGSLDAADQAKIKAKQLAISRDFDRAAKASVRKHVMDTQGVMLPDQMGVSRWRRQVDAAAAGSNAVSESRDFINNLRNR